MKRIIFIIFAGLIGWCGVAAQEAHDEMPVISLITCGQGDESYQLEGHTALRIQYPDGRDMAVNWGLFDFNSPNFAYRFIKGETDYMVGAIPFAYFLNSYTDPPRQVDCQRLCLSPAETRELLRLIEENLREENRTYRYNYVLDNCATRPLAIVEKALSADGARLMVDMPPAETTFREEMRRYHSRFPAYQMFIDYALGSGLDRPITLREQAFAPIFLEELAARSYIIDADGSCRQFAGPVVTLLPGPSEPYAEGGVSPWVVVLALFVVTSLIVWRDIRRGRVTRWYHAVFYFLLGLLGLLLTFLIFVSSHEATSPNVNYLWLNPLCLIVPLLTGFKRCRGIVYWYQIVNFVAVMVYVVACPLFDQSGNWLFAPLIVSDLLLSGSYIYITSRTRK